MALPLLLTGLQLATLLVNRLTFTQRAHSKARKRASKSSTPAILDPLLLSEYTRLVPLMNQALTTYEPLGLTHTTYLVIEGVDLHLLARLLDAALLHLGHQKRVVCNAPFLLLVDREERASPLRPRRCHLFRRQRKPTPLRTPGSA